MKKFVDVSEDFKEYMNPKKYFINKKKACCNIGLVVAISIVLLFIATAIFAALKYKKDHDFFNDDFDDDFGVDDALYARESDFDE